MNPTQFLLNLIMLALTDHTASGTFNGPLEAAYLGLYISPTPALNPASLMAAITEATYAGYARQLIVWFPPYIDIAGPESLSGNALNFQPSGSTPTNMITGIFWADALTAGNLLAWMPVPPPGIPLGNPTNAMIVNPIWQLPYGPKYGTPSIIN